MNMSFMQVPGAPSAPQAPSIYPAIDAHHQQSFSPPAVFYNGQEVNSQPTLMQQPIPDARPQSVFILEGKPPLGPEPLKTQCPYCRSFQMSRVESRVGLKTHCAALVCCLIGLICLVPLPYFMKVFKSLHHYCNNCGQYLGSYPTN